MKKLYVELSCLIGGKDYKNQQRSAKFKVGDNTISIHAGSPMFHEDSHMDEPFLDISKYDKNTNSIESCFNGTFEQLRERLARPKIINNNKIMRNFNKRMLVLLAVTAGAFLLLALLASIFGEPIKTADAAYYDNFEFECGQEYFVIEDEDGYKSYEAFAHWTDTWRGLELSSMEAKYLNGAMTINSRVGFSDPKYMGSSPLTCKQLETPSFVGEFHIPVEEETLEVENKKLKAKNDDLQSIVKSLSEQVEGIMKVLNNLTK